MYPPNAKESAERPDVDDLIFEKPVPQQLLAMLRNP